MVARVRRCEPLEAPPQVFARIDPAPQARPEQAVEHGTARTGPHVVDVQVCEESPDEESAPLVAVMPPRTAQHFPPAESIPRVIHQIWLGSKPIPQLFLEWSDNGHLHYADVHASEAGVAWTASPSGHPFWEIFLEKVAWELDRGVPSNAGDIVSTTGPCAFQYTMNYWCQGKVRRRFADPAAPDKHMGLLLCDAAVVIYHRDIFYPYYHKEHHADQFSQTLYPRAWAAPHWGGSWIGG